LQKIKGIDASSISLCSITGKNILLNDERALADLYKNCCPIDYSCVIEKGILN
jgi:hypothetical protein